MKQFWKTVKPSKIRTQELQSINRRNWCLSPLRLSSTGLNLWAHYKYGTVLKKMTTMIGCPIEMRVLHCKLFGRIYCSYIILAIYNRFSAFWLRSKCSIFSYQFNINCIIWTKLTELSTKLIQVLIMIKWEKSPKNPKKLARGSSCSELNKLNKAKMELLIKNWATSGSKYPLDQNERKYSLAVLVIPVACYKLMIFHSYGQELK